MVTQQSSITDFCSTGFQCKIAPEKILSTYSQADKCDDFIPNELNVITTSLGK